MAADKGDIVVVGAGLVGSLLAYILQKRGFQVTLFERYGDIRLIPSLGRSINLVITSRGLRACDAIGGGLREEVLSLAVAVTGRVIHQLDGSVQFQRYGKDDTECNYSISRYGLNKFLIGKAEEAGVKIHFGHCLETSETKFADSDDFCGGDVGSVLCFDVTAVDGTKSKRYVRCQCPVIGADGGGSRVRHAMRQQGLTEFTETLLGIETGFSHSYKEILFPKESGLISHGLHIWPRNKHMLMALANLDGSMTGTLYMDTDGSDESFAALQTREQVQQFFDKYYSETLEMIGGADRAIDQMLNNPNGLLGTVRTVTWNHRGRVLLIGDAAHAIVPFFGQGMNCGFEDVLELTELFIKYNVCGGHIGNIADSADAAEAPEPMDASRAADWAACFHDFAVHRKPNADAIADLALENFEEMRDRVSDRAFLLQKRVESRIENAIGSKFRSGYAMICYGGAGNVTYSNAFKLSRVQNEILQELIAAPSAELALISDDSWGSLLDPLAERVSLEDAERLIDAKLVPLQQELGIDLSKVSHH